MPFYQVRKFWWKILSLIIFISLQPFQISAASNSSPLILCKLRKEVRTIRVLKKEDFFVTVYSKNGKDQTIGKTQYFQSGIVIARNLRDKLEANAWSCREVSDSQITTSTPVLKKDPAQ